MLKLHLAVLYLVLVAVTAEQDTCMKPQCTCEFEGDDVAAESPKAAAAKKSEVLAAAAGAMSPLLIGGAGLGIYKLVKSRGGDTPSLDRSASDLSDTSEGPPPKYSRRGSSGRSLISPQPAQPRGVTNNWAF